MIEAICNEIIIHESRKEFCLLRVTDRLPDAIVLTPS